jgi:hypothetical protein
MIIAAKTKEINQEPHLGPILNAKKQLGVIIKM